MHVVGRLGPHSLRYWLRGGFLQVLGPLRGRRCAGTGSTGRRPGNAVVSEVAMTIFGRSLYSFDG